MKEICLLDQVYVQDSDLTVAKYVDKVAKENNAKVKLRSSSVLRLVKVSRRKKRTLQKKLQNRWECKFLKPKVLEALENPVKRAFSRAFLRSGANP